MRRFLQIAAAAIVLAACVTLPAQRLIASDAPTAVFVENRGQFDPAVKYQLTARTSTVWLTASGIVFNGVRKTRTDGETATGAPERVVFSETFVGSNPNAVLEADQPSSNAYDYLTDTGAARWPVQSFLRVDYKDVWPGISVRLTGNSMGIKQEFIIQAGANADNIAVTYQGIDGMTIDADGSLSIATALGILREGMPKVSQKVGGRRIDAPGRYKLTGPGTYGFELNTYAREYPVIIGPAQLDFSQSAAPATAGPVVDFFSMAPTSTLPGQATIGTFLISGATTATLNGIIANCSDGECGGTILFYPTSTTNYVLEASGAGGNLSVSQEVEVGEYQPNPPPVPAGLQVTWQGACWIKGFPKSVCNGACQGMAFNLNVPTPPSALPLEATLYLNSTTCNPSSQDNLNDIGTLTGSGGWIFWFDHHPNRKNSSAIWTYGNQSSGCVSYASAKVCR
ncbi:MAG: hypothetical protein ABSH32_13115 [Bryobacteraceae bacterium]|jgi:hypothetical protein